MVSRDARPETARGGGRDTPDGFLFERTGGDPALDLVNTVVPRPASEPRELLPDFDSLVRWGEQAGLLDPDRATALRVRAGHEPRGAATALERVRRFRETLFQLFSAAAAGRTLPDAALARLNAAWAESSAHARLASDGRVAAWGWDDDDALDRVLWQVARAAVDLLTSPRLDRVRECHADECSWLFLDLSKNRSRRWCDMAVCGNRSKVRRYRAARRGPA